MVEFKIVPHQYLPSVDVVEIWVNGVFRATLYPQEPNSVRLISDHLRGEPIQEVGRPQAWRATFKT